MTDLRCQVQGDRDGGWIVDIHDGEAHDTYSPTAATAEEAAVLALLEHGQGHGRPVQAAQRTSAGATDGVAAEESAPREVGPRARTVTTGEESPATPESTGMQNAGNPAESGPATMAATELNQAGSVAPTPAGETGGEEEDEDEEERDLRPGHRLP